VQPKRTEWEERHAHCVCLCEPVVSHVQ